MSQCCDESEEFNCAEASGFLEKAPSWPFGFIKQAPPFETTGDCCEIICEGHHDVERFSLGLEYVSLDDGAGGFIETCSGRTGVIEPYGYGWRPTPSCCPLWHPTYNPDDVDCHSWTQDGAHTVTCQVTDGYGGGGGGNNSACDPSAVVNTWYGGSASCRSVCCTTYQSCCSTYSATCCTPGGTTPTYQYCYCDYSGCITTCKPFRWYTGNCTFTGTLFNNDCSDSKPEATAEIYYDVCENKWIISTDWTGSNGQWPNGQKFYGECTGCTGLDQCVGQRWSLLGAYGYFKPETGPGSGFVCPDQAWCGAALENSKCQSDYHGIPLWDACY